MHIGRFRGGDRGSKPPLLENHKLLYVSLEYWYGNPREAIGPKGSTLGPIASQEKPERPSMKYGTLMTKIKISGPPPTPLTNFSESAHDAD